MPPAHQELAEDQLTHARLQIFFWGERRDSDLRPGILQSM